MSVNGLGDRAGNASFEEIAASLEILYGIKTRIKLEKLYALSRYVETITGIQCQRHKPVVGENAFLEESSSHMMQVEESKGSGLPEANVPFMAHVVGQTQRYVYGSTTLWGEALEAKIKARGRHPSASELQKVRELLAREIQTKRYLTEDEVDVVLSQAMGKT